MDPEERQERTAEKGFLKGEVHDTGWPIDGKTLVFRRSEKPRGYILINWKGRDDDAVRDTMFLTACLAGYELEETREEFMDEWAAGQYEPPGIFVLDDDKVTVKAYLDDSMNEIKPKEPKEKARKRRKLLPAEREMIYKAMDGRCAYCGKKIDQKDMCVDHVIPLAAGGLDDLENMRCSCRACNHYKATMSISAFRRMLSKEPALLRRDSVAYKNAIRFGLVKETHKPIVFYFETRANRQMEIEHREALREDRKRRSAKKRRRQRVKRGRQTRKEMKALRREMREAETHGTENFK